MQVVISGKYIRDLGFTRLSDKVELAWETVNRTEGSPPPGPASREGLPNRGPRTHVGKRLHAKKC